jgi:hypothetical protein
VVGDEGTVGVGLSRERPAIDADLDGLADGNHGFLVQVVARTCQDFVPPG